MAIITSSILIQKSAELIFNARSVVALTGAGSSTPSGIPDFRSKGSGLWNRYSQMEVASLSAFRQNPERFFEWFRPFAQNILTAKPNATHFALAKLEQMNRLDTIITQNIDNLHQRAGSVNVLQVHGTLSTLTCIGCYRNVLAKNFQVSYINTGEIPYCDRCGNILKPDVVLFEEQLPAKTWLKARNVTQTCDLMVVLGTSLVVSPVAQLPEQAKKNGAKIIIINKTATYMDEYADVVIHEDTAAFLPRIIENLIIRN
ncbi:MAG: SIR2 family NAD-dependent protein deacylase [Anaerolineales bacterium]|jgi:NAD-dependent deacetylase